MFDAGARHFRRAPRSPPCPHPLKARVDPPSTALMLLDLMAGGLRREGVTEFAAMSGQRPCVKVGGSYQPIAPSPVTEDELIELLMTIGGLPYVDRLGPEAL